MNKSEKASKLDNGAKKKRAPKVEDFQLPSTYQNIAKKTKDNYVQKTIKFGEKSFISSAICNGYNPRTKESYSYNAIILSKTYQDEKGVPKEFHLKFPSQEGVSMRNGLDTILEAQNS